MVQLGCLANKLWGSLPRVGLQTRATVHGFCMCISVDVNLVPHAMPKSPFLLRNILAPFFLSLGISCQTIMNNKLSYEYCGDGLRRVQLASSDIRSPGNLIFPQ